MVAVGEAAQPDDVAVVEAGQQLQLQVEGVRPSRSRSVSVSLAVAVPEPDDGGDEAAGEARPVRRAALSAGAAEHRREAARGGLHLLGREPPEERQGTCVGFHFHQGQGMDSFRQLASRADGGKRERENGEDEEGE